MTDFNRTESAMWQQSSDKIVGELHAGVDKALAKAASRGYATAPGDVLAEILAAGQNAKGKLTEENAKIFESRHKTLFEQDLFAMELIVKISKLSTELYASQLFNALTLEIAEKDALRDRGNADVLRLNAEVDVRQKAIIQARAEMEQRITILKAELVAAEAKTLPYETALIDAQLATATKKLEIIDSLYLVLAAEELVLAAENRRAATLTVLLAAQLIVAEIKKQMIPFYIEKADARTKLAAAITAEIPVKKAIEELGYARIELKDTDEAAKHLLRAAEGEMERAKETLVKQDKVTLLARTQSMRMLQEYANAVRTSILSKREALEKDGIDLRLDTSLARQRISVDNQVALAGHEIGNLTTELVNLLQNILEKAAAHIVSIEASGDTKETSFHHSTNYQWKTII